MSSKCVYTCDQCKAKTKLLGDLPAGWIHLGFDTHTCQNCGPCNSELAFMGVIIYCEGVRGHRETPHVYRTRSGVTVTWKVSHAN